jgi:cytochrome P450
MTVAKKERYDKTSDKRQGAHLGRLAEGGGKPVRVDTAGADLVLLDELVGAGFAPSRAEAYRKAMREAHARAVRKKLLDTV